MGVYRIYNAPMQTTAAIAKVTTGTAIKTMLQLATPSTNQARIHAWGFSSDDPPGADAVFELIQTDVAATVTAHSASGVQPLDPNAPAALFTLGTSATGFTATVEGTITAVRTFDAKLMDVLATDLSYEKIFTPALRPVVAVSRFLRVRVTTPTTAVDLLTWFDVEQL